MPPLVIPSPTLLDQSFPRDDIELEMIAVSLEKLLEEAQQEKCGLLITETLRDFVEFFDWNRTGPYPLLMELHRLLALLFLQPSGLLFEIDLSSMEEDKLAHPLPKTCSKDGLSDEWANEVGKIFLIHKKYTVPGEPSIGVACAAAFSAKEKDTYEECAAPVEEHAFPLVGPDDIVDLEDVYEWDVPNYIHLKSVSFALAYRNIHLIGAVEVQSPANSSHYIVKFKNRSWPLDYNTDPIPERFIGQLKSITGYPVPVIKTALIEGRLPDKRIKIPEIHLRL